MHMCGVLVGLDTGCCGCARYQHAQTRPHEPAHTFARTHTGQRGAPITHSVSLCDCSCTRSKTRTALPVTCVRRLRSSRPVKHKTKRRLDRRDFPLKFRPLNTASCDISCIVRLIFVVTACGTCADGYQIIEATPPRRGSARLARTGAPQRTVWRRPRWAPNAQQRRMSRLPSEVSCALFGASRRRPTSNAIHDSDPRTVSKLVCQVVPCTSRCGFARLWLWWRRANSRVYSCFFSCHAPAGSGAPCLSCPVM